MHKGGTLRGDLFPSNLMSFSISELLSLLQLKVKVRRLYQPLSYIVLVTYCMLDRHSITVCVKQKLECLFYISNCFMVTSCMLDWINILLQYVSNKNLNVCFIFQSLRFSLFSVKLLKEQLF